MLGVMSRPIRLPWLPRVLFRTALAMAGALVALVFLAPVLDNGIQRPRGWRQFVAVFARDLTLRRTAVASAVGLGVTALVFFRPPKSRADAITSSRPPSDVVGA